MTVRRSPAPSVSITAVAMTGPQRYLKVEMTRCKAFPALPNRRNRQEDGERIRRRGRQAGSIEELALMASAHETGEVSLVEGIAMVQFRRVSIQRMERP